MPADRFMTRQHFQFIADVLKDLDIPEKHRKRVVQEFSRALPRANWRFDRNRFERACEKEDTF